jgi:hypothetical protein
MKNDPSKALEAWKPQRHPGALFRDGEIDALYAYLDASDAVLLSYYTGRNEPDLVRIREIVRMRLDGLSTRSIAAHYHVYRHAINMRLNRAIGIGQRILRRIPSTARPMTLMIRRGWKPIV